MAQTSAAKALKVLVGGGTGFIGRHVSNILRDRGHQVSKKKKKTISDDSPFVI